MNGLAAAALAAGELICEFSDGYRKSLLAEIAGDAPRTELLLIYDFPGADSARVLASDKPGRRPILVREGKDSVHFIQPEGASHRARRLAPANPGESTSRSNDEQQTVCSTCWRGWSWTCRATRRR